MSSPYTVHPMESVFRAGEIERQAHDRKIAELWKAVQGEQHDDALDYFRRGFFLGSNYQKDQLASEASPLGHAAKEAECVAKCLDDAGTPKTEAGKELSLWGRVVRYAAALPLSGGVQVDAARELLKEARDVLVTANEKFMHKEIPSAQIYEVVEKINAALSTGKEDAARELLPMYVCPDGCGCEWRDNLNGTMSLYDEHQKSCSVCETLPLHKLIPAHCAPGAIQRHLYVDQRHDGAWLVCVERQYDTKPEAQAACKSWARYYAAIASQQDGGRGG